MSGPETSGIRRPLYSLEINLICNMKFANSLVPAFQR